MAVRRPAIIGGRVAGTTTWSAVRRRERVRRRALHRYSLAMLEAPRWTLIQTGKKTAKAVEMTFAPSPMPNQTMVRGMMATGGRGRRIWMMGPIAALAA